MNKKLLSLAAIVFLIALFFGVNIIAQNVGRNARVDLTADKLYTLSEGARAIARSVDEPIKFTFYFNAKDAVDKPQFLSLAKRVRDTLEEFSRESGGKVAVKTVSPEQFSEEEEQAVRDGVEPIPLTTGGDVMYFGLVGTNSINGKQVIPQFDPRSERMLEYDLSKLLYSLKSTAKKKVGVMSSVGLTTYSLNAQGQPQPKAKWQVFVQLAEAFTVEEIPTTATSIPEGIDVLAIVHPKKLSDETLYAIDQFVMRGGRLVAFVDPQCQFDDSIRGTNQYEIMMVDRGSSLNKLLNAWGVEVPETTVLLDNTYAPRDQAQSGSGVVETRSLPVAVLREGAITRDDEIGRALASVTMVFAGEIRKKADFQGDKALTITPILQSSEDSMMIEKARVTMVQQMTQVAAMFQPENTKHTLAARLSGNVKSAFPDGPPKPADPAAPAPDASKHLKESKGSVNMLLTADVDTLFDRAWLQEVQLGRQRQFMQIASNGTYFFGGIENMTGSSELLSIRPRSVGTRPFEVVDEIRAKTTKEVVTAERAADEKVAEFERKLTEELRKRQPKADGTFDAPPDLEQRITALRAELTAANKEKRKVRLEANKDIDRLGRKVKAVNIALIPAVVAVFAVGLGLYRANRRSTVRRAAQS